MEESTAEQYMSPEWKQLYHAQLEMQRRMNEQSEQYCKQIRERQQQVE